MSRKFKFDLIDKSKRLYCSSIPIIAVTGSIGTGKTSVCKILQELGYFILNADELIKEIYGFQETINFISQISPNTIDSENKKIDFPKLRKEFFNNPELKKDIENFLYPKLEILFKHKVSLTQQDVIFYDVPLLFEKKINESVDFIICVSCAHNEQLNRIMKRDNIDKESAQKIISSQIDVKEKEKLSNITIVNNEISFEELKQNVKKTLQEVFIV